MTKGAGGPADDILEKLAKKYAVNAGEISLRYCIDQDIVPITTSSKEQRLSDYLRAMTFKLTPAEIKQVRKLCFTLFLTFADDNSRSTRPARRSISVGSGRINMMRTTGGEQSLGRTDRDQSSRSSLVSNRKRSACFVFCECL